jgi:cyclase
MVRPLLAVLFLSLFASAGSAQSRKARKEKNTPVNFKVEQLAEGIWAAIHNDQYGQAICNAGIVDLGDKTLVFDPFMTPKAARELSETAFELTGKPVTIVVNSHYHNDHIRGNQVFGESATIISTAFTRSEIERVEPQEQAWESKHAPSLLQAVKKRMNSAGPVEREELPLWIGYYQGMVESSDELKITLPDVVFRDSLWIMGSKRKVKLVERQNGHTESDAVMVVPDEGIAFMGDLLFVGRHPWVSDGKPADWQATLKGFYEDPSLKTFIPGHGPVSKRESLKQLYEYLTDIQFLCKDAYNDSLRTEVMQKPIPEAYQEWYFSKFYQPNLQYLFSLLPKINGEMKQ